MKVILMRTKEASVSVKSEVIASIDKGIVLFVGFSNSDDENTISNMAQKVVNLRVFEDENNKLMYSVKDKNYKILCIPNFTLYANIKKGRRPSFEDVLGKEKASILFDNFILLLKASGVVVESGKFGEHMEILLNLDGPVNIILE